MTYFVTALTNDKARLIEQELRTSDENAADMIATVWGNQGHIIVRRSEG